MRPLISREHYYDDEQFQREQEQLFGRVWQLAGFRSDLAKANDFITVQVGGRSVVVQNFDGELRAFLNVCSHRFARIHCEAKGSGPLRCSYHGWSYNKDGVPYSIPSRPRFDDLTPEVVQGLALQRYVVETCGEMVFVRAPVEGASLRAFLGDAYETVAGMAGALGDRVYYNEMIFRANWKLCIENGLEAYHVGFVHQNTFKALGTSGMDFSFSGPHSAWATGVEPAMQSRMSKVAKLGRMPYPIEGYVHQFIFPNVTISSVCGTAFGLQILQPVSPTETRLVGIVFLSRMDGSDAVKASASDMLGPAAAEFTLDVANEDRAVCEAVQLGVRHTAQPGILSEEEERVLAFHVAYLEQMQPAPATSHLTRAAARPA